MQDKTRTIGSIGLNKQAVHEVVPETWFFVKHLARESTFIVDSVLKSEVLSKRSGVNLFTNFGMPFSSASCDKVNIYASRNRTLCVSFRNIFLELILTKFDTNSGTKLYF